MSDYQTLMNGGAVLPETETGRGADGPIPDFQAADQTRPTVREVLSRGKQELAAIKRDLARPKSPAAAATAAPTLWDRAKSPSPILGVPWGVVVAVGVAGVIVAYRKLA